MARYIKGYSASCEYLAMINEVGDKESISFEASIKTFSEAEAKNLLRGALDEHVQCQYGIGARVVDILWIKIKEINLKKLEKCSNESIICRY